MDHDQDSREQVKIPPKIRFPVVLRCPAFSKPLFWIGFAVVAILGIGLVGKYGSRIWRTLERRLHGPAIVSTERIPDDGTYRNLIFLHHSTGRALIDEGKVRELFSRKGYQFWDHDYNFEGLVKPDGTRTHTHYDIPEVVSGADSGGNTDPEGLAVLFSQAAHNPPDNAFSRLLQHRVIIFKSCFPNSAIKSGEMLERQQALYLKMRDVIDRHPDRLFILLTTPPLHPKMTNLSEATRARSLSQWLQSDVFLGGHPNLLVFDFFGLLADPGTHTLKTDYQPEGGQVDSHPNARANVFIAPRFVDFVDRAVRGYGSAPHGMEAPLSGTN